MPEVEKDEKPEKKKSFERERNLTRKLYKNFYRSRILLNTLKTNITIFLF